LPVYISLTLSSCLSLSPVPFAFVVLKESATENQQAVVGELRLLVATKIAKYAVPDHFLVKSVPSFLFKLYVFKSIYKERL